MIALTNATVWTSNLTWKNGAILINGERIAAVGPSEELASEILNADKQLDLEGRCILPGLVDAHTHLIFGGNRIGEFKMRCAGATYEEIAQNGGGIRSTIRATQSLSLDDLTQIGLRHAKWLLRCGTTTAEAKSGYGMDMETERRLLEAVGRVGAESPLRTVPTLLALHAVPDGWSKEDFVQQVITEQLPQLAPLAHYVDAFVEDGYFEHDDAARLAHNAKDLGLQLRLHVDQLTNSGGAQLAARLGATTADHLEQTDELGIEALSGSQTVPVLLPASVHCLAKKRYPNARRMIEAGLPVVIATDFNPGSSPTPSLPFAMNLACTQMGMSPQESLLGCTTHAARSIGLQDDVGDLRPGMFADLSIWEVHEPDEIAYWPAAPLLHSVWTQGKPLA